jgi:PTH1 family peptidyl-tRNA hydrolase
MKLIIGLGNPGLRYRHTRHNIGFLVIGEISRNHRIRVSKRRYRGLFGKGVVEGSDVGLFIPQTYMNLSGEAVKEAVRGEGVAWRDLLVICDDKDIPFGSLRLREKGSGGGHKGLHSIIACCQTNDFPRLRVGIGQNEAIGDTRDFVLRRFGPKERRSLAAVIEQGARCAEAWVTDGPEKAMTGFNNRSIGEQ